MKRITLLVDFLLLALFSFAQERTELPKDESGKYIYYEVVNQAPTTVDSLKIRLLDFLNSQKKELSVKSQTASNVINAEGKIVIRKNLTLASHPSGEIRYNFFFEVDAGKFRFWLSNFEFIPYQKDRYGNFVPSTNIGQALENDVKRWGTAQWNEYRLQAADYSSDFALRLKKHLALSPAAPVAPPEKKVISKTW
jgi:hypothetical protein